MKKILLFLKEYVFKIENNEKLKFRNLIFYTLFLFIIFFFFLWLSFFIVIRSTKEYQLDNLQKMDLMKALIILQKKNLKPRIVKKTSKKYKKYTVIEQRPSPGTMVKKNRVITLTVSTGNLTFKIPKLVGLKTLAAKKKILNVYKKKESIPSVILVKEYSSKFSKGKVFRQQPKAKQIVDINEGIFLFVSKGKEKKEITLKNYVNRSFYPVKKGLEELGIKVKLFFKTSNKKSGTILKQNIDKKTILNLEEDHEIEFLVAVKNEDDIQERLRVYSFDWKNITIPMLKKVKVKVTDTINERTIFLDTIIIGNPFEISYLGYGNGFIEIFVNNKIYDKKFF